MQSREEKFLLDLLDETKRLIVAKEVMKERRLSNYNLRLRNVDLVEGHVTYPDYICLVDYPNGGGDPAWFTLSEMLEQAKAFLSQFQLDEHGKII